MNIVIAGLGRYVNGIEKCLKQNVEVMYYFDNAITNRNKERNGKKILSHYQCYTNSIDYVVIGIMGFAEMMHELQECGFQKNQIIPFFDSMLDFESYHEIFEPQKAIVYSLKCNMLYLQQRLLVSEENERYFREHIAYEIMDSVKNNELQLPNICSVEETCDCLLQQRVSLSRYGDGEFEIIFGKAKDIYQGNDMDLATRLKEILISDERNHLVALADDYGNLDAYREENQRDIRKYMTLQKRKMHYECIDMDKKYYNAYISRPYVIYPHEKRKEAQYRFDRLKQIWENKDVLFVEGELTRMGVGNDLFANAKSIQRIIAPNVNAFCKYGEILEKTRAFGQDKLILIALGPTATVLAYDLAKEGYWAIDIGHLDLEYEWFLKGEGYSHIPNKYNNEVLGDDEVVPIKDEEYEKSILGIISLNE